VVKSVTLSGPRERNSVVLRSVRRVRPGEKVKKNHAAKPRSKVDNVKWTQRAQLCCLALGATALGEIGKGKKKEEKKTSMKTTGEVDTRVQGTGLFQIVHLHYRTFVGV